MSKLHAIKDKLIEVILEQHSFTGNPDTPSLKSLQKGVLNNELTRLIEESTKDDKTDLPLLNFLLPVIVLLNSFTHSNAFLKEDQQMHVKEVLVELFTTLNTLCVTSQTSVYRSKSNIACQGFLNSSNTYSHIGETISEKLKGVWDLEETNADIDGIEDEADKFIPSKVDLLVLSYQNKVEPEHLRSENERLQLELAEKNKLIAVLRLKLSAAMETSATAAPLAPNPARGHVQPPLFRGHYQQSPAVTNKASQTPPPSNESQCAQQ